MIVVLNFGSQFAHLIARRIRDLGVKSEILPFNSSANKIAALNPKGIILSGSPSSVTEKKSPRPDSGIFKMGVPVLGICYGEHVMGAMLGGKVKSGKNREFGREILNTKKQSPLFKGLDKKEQVWFSHGDQVVKLPPRFKTIASTSDCAEAAIADIKKNFYAIQFHPEVTHTAHGKKILSNFVFSICGAEKDWRIASIKDELIKSIRDEVGKSHVMLGISGGVDSFVAGLLLHEAIGNRLHAVLVDTGLLRENESSEVEKALKKAGFRKNFHVAHAKKYFLERLSGITNPEKKRKRIGHGFIKIFEDMAKAEFKKHPIAYLAQGTIYPDRIESAEPTKHASKIKSHHNLTLPEKFGFKIMEPLRDLYKDEVRKLGKTLGAPDEILMRHPFPGPGLAIRIVGEVTENRLRLLREADSIFIEELKRAGEYQKIWQAFAVLLPLKTVGVMGDARTYEYMLSLRAVDSIDGMSADWHKIPETLLERISSRIVREVRGINRVLFDITQKPPATIEYE